MGLGNVFSRLRGGLRALVSKTRAEQDLSDELREYEQAIVDEYLAKGLSRDAAVRAARVEIGSVEAVKDRVRDAGWESVVESVWQDVRVSFRLLRKQPGFTAAAVATLAIGIGGTTAIFSVVDALFLKAPAGVVNAASVRKLYIKRDAGPMQTPGGGPGSWADYVAMRGSGSALAGVGAYLPPELVDLGRGAAAEQVYASVVSHDFLTVLGVRPAAGRLFIAEDDGVPGAHPFAVVSHSLWRSRFGGGTDIGGRTLLVNGVLLEIVGVTEAGFTGIETDAIDIWLASSMAGPLSLTGGEGDWRQRLFLQAKYVVRLAPRAEESAAVVQAADALRLRAAFDELDPTPEVVLTPLVHASVPGGTWAGNLSLWLALVAALVLVIACANVANLLLARAITRRRELAVRLSLGAGPWRLARQHLTESLVLASLGGAAGVVVAYWGIGLVRQFPLPPSAGHIDARLLVFALGMSMLSGVLFGVLPAVRAVQVDPLVALKDSPAFAGPRRNYTRRALVVLQMSLSVALLVGAGLFVRSLRNVATVHSGVDLEHTLVARVDLRRAGYTPEAREAFYDDALARLSGLPGVERAAVVHLEPFHGGTPIAMWARPGETTVQRRPGILTLASPGYFEAIGMRLLRGRTFEPGDRRGAEPVAVVDESMSRVIAADGNVVGQCVPFNAQIRSGGCTRIVGVVETQRRFFLVDAPHPSVFLVREQFPDAVPFGSPSLVAKTRNPAADAGTVRAALQSLRNDSPFVSVEPLAESIRDDVMPFRVGATLFSLFGVLALVLAAVGLHGVLGYFVTERTPEIGIRRSLGAPVGSVVRLVIRQAMTPVGVGLALGLIAAFAGTRYLGSLLFGVEARDPISFVAAAVFLVCVALVAALVPAVRAARIDPTTALRQS